MKFLGIIWRIFLVLFITIITGAVTCGGNMFLDGMLVHLFGGGRGYGSQYSFGLFILWGMEIFIIFIWSIWKREYIVSLTERIWKKSGKIIKIILITIIGGSLFSLMNFGLNAFSNWRYMNTVESINLIEIGILFCFSIWYILFRKNPNQVAEEVITLPSKQTLELMSSLSQIDISNIASVTFIPTNGQGFSIKTPNIKRLAVYITTKLGKTTFEPEELRKTFDYVLANISSDLSKTDFDLV